MDSMDSINSWALTQTADQVKDVVSSLDTDTKLLLVSVAYYQSKNGRTYVPPSPV